MHVGEWLGWCVCRVEGLEGLGSQNMLLKINFHTGGLLRY